MKTKTVFAGSSRQLAPWFRQNWRVGRTAGLLLMTALVLSNCGGETKADKEKAAAAASSPCGCDSSHSKDRSDLQRIHGPGGCQRYCGAASPRGGFPGRNSLRGGPPREEGAVVVHA